MLPNGSQPRARRVQPEHVVGFVGVILGLTLLLWIVFEFGGEVVTGWASDWIQLYVMAALAISCLFAMRSSPVGRTGWGLFAAMASFWFVGQAVWIPINNGSLNAEWATTATNLFFLCGTPLMLLGTLYLFTQGLSAQGAYRRLVDAFLIVSAVVIGLWYLFLGDVAASLDHSDFFGIVFAIVYPIGDAIVLGLILAMLPRMEPTMRRRLTPVAIGLSLIALADVSFAYTMAQSAYQAGNWFDIAWITGETVLACSAVRWARASPRAVGRQGAASFNVYPLVAVVAVILTIVMEYATSGDLEPLPMYLGAAMVAALCLRQVLHIGEIRRGTARLAHALQSEKQARFETSQSEARLLAAQRLAGVGFWEASPDGRSMTSSREMLSLLGAGANVSPGQPCSTNLLWDALTSDEQTTFREAWLKATNEGAPADLEHKLRRPDESIRWVRTRFQPFTFADGRRGMFGVVHDITDIRLAEQARRDSELARAEVRRLAEVNEFRTQLLNLASHELNTPIGAVKLQLHILKLKLEGRVSEDIMGAVVILDRNVERLANLVADTLDVARIQSGKLSLKRQPTHLEALVRDALETFVPLADRQGVMLSSSIEKGLTGEIDPKRVTQILFNLVSNALKFTPPGGNVSVSAASVEGRIRITVTDTGSGLSADQIAQLFRPFVQVHSGEVVNRGTGLGLFISKGIAEQHGGRIWCESQGIGHGSTFCLDLPARGCGAGIAQPVLQAA